MLLSIESSSLAGSLLICVIKESFLSFKTRRRAIFEAAYRDVIGFESVADLAVESAEVVCVR